MTQTDYRNLVSQIRYQFSCLASFLVTAEEYGVSDAKKEATLKVIGLYLQALYEYYLPAKIVGTSSDGGSIITLPKTIDPDDYSAWLNHTISGVGIQASTRVTKIEATQITLSKTTTVASSNSIYNLGENCLSIEEFTCIIAHINQLLGTNYCATGFYTDFDLGNYVPIAASGVLLYGSSSVILIGTDIVAALNYDATFIGEDTSIQYNTNWEYPYFAYPATYPDLTNILDQEGDDVLASGAFDKYLLDVTFDVSDPTTQYKVYRTDYLTIIPGDIYTFKF